jgi:hypothetical protein
VSRWEDRALPVLVALNESTDRNLRGGILPVGPGNLGAAVLGLELSDDAVHDTILQLGDLGYLEYNDISYTTRGSATFIGLRVTGRGLQVLGQWPRFEALVSPATLAEVVGRLADYAAPQEAPPMKRAAEVIRRLGAAGLRSAAIGIGSQLLRGALGLP